MAMSPGSDTLIMSAMERRNLLALFAALPLLRELDVQSVGELADDIQWFSVPSGMALYSAGEAADGLYAIVNGAFGIYAAQAIGGSKYLGKLVAGQLAGDVEVISGRERSTTLVALRDCEVARLPSPTFEKLVAKHPHTLRLMARGLAEQVDALQQQNRRQPSYPKTFAIVPCDASECAAALGADLVACLAMFGRAELISSAQATDRTSHWFHRLERANKFVVYLTDDRPSHWSRLCIRRADMVLLVADAHRDPQRWIVLDTMHEVAAAIRTAEMVLVHRAGHRPHRTREWLEAQPCRGVHHVHGREDVARLARLTTGRSVGLVLSGGGARGFAHIGVLRALREAGIAVDSIGASSIGAIIGAGWADGWSYEEMLDRMRRGFVASNPLSDYTLPLMSLVAGRKVSRLLRQQFGDTDIEDLRLPYFCVSANLASGLLAVHRRDTLWVWLRASIAIPGVLPPVFTKKQAYVDGATLNNLPVDVMREDFRGRIIAVDVSSDRGFASELEMTELPPLWKIRSHFRHAKASANIMQILLRAGMLNSAATSIAQRESADLLLRPPLAGVDLLDWRSFERTIDLGYHYALEALESAGSKLSTAAEPQSVFAPPAR
jgi:NTE family protein